MINRTTLFGYLVADPETRYTKTGKAICSLRIAYNETNKDTLFMSVDVWDKQAEICGKVLKKGSNVIVDGRLCCDSYENKDGQKVNKIFITADRVNFVPRFAQSSSESKPSSPEQAKAKTKTESAPKQKAQKVTVPEEGEESSNDEGGDDIPF